MSWSKVLAAYAVLVFALALSAGLSQPSRAESGSDRIADEIDELVQGVMQQQSIPGVAIAVIRKGEVIKAQGYGLANIEHQVPVKPETIFQSGSVGKQFTSFAIMLLVDDGKIAIDDPISKHLSPTPDGWKAITVRHLLTHTSGVGDMYPTINLRRDYTEQQLVEAAAKVKPDFAPGEKWAYSNTGYCLLGIIVHNASGTPYGEFLQERIFKKLGMTTARIISEADIVPNRSAGYRRSADGIKNQDWVSPTLNTTGDGAIYLSVLDMIRWDAGLRERKLLTAESYAQMWTPATLNDGAKTDYAFGWSIDEATGRRVQAHDGAWQGFTASIVRHVDDDVTVAAFTNLAGGRAGRITREVAKQVIGERAAASQPRGGD